MRVIVLILDALGVGEMPDVTQVRPQDRGANTLRSILQGAPSLTLDPLARLGLGNAADLDKLLPPVEHPLASYGRCRLAHQGADSYLGHQEIMGTIPKAPVMTLMLETVEALEAELAAQGFCVTHPLPGKPLLLVNEAVVIGDNLEADAGMNINLTVPTDEINFALALEMGRIVRQLVKVSRVIVFGGPGITAAGILQRVFERSNGQIGVDSPSLDVYNARLHIQHMGYGVDPERQAASIVASNGHSVTLLGKMADLIVCPGAVKDPLVPTAKVMEAIRDHLQSMNSGLIAATVQETDLSAHQGDLPKLAQVMREVDAGLERLLPALNEDDVLIISADHGNDPCLQVGLHTREETPLLVYRRGRRGAPLGTRATLADIGATVSALLGGTATQDGTIIELWRES